jgi:hypothetical protein
VYRVGSTAMVVKRKTRNNGNTHHKPVVPRVQTLLKCAPSCRTPLMDGEAEGPPHRTLLAAGRLLSQPYHRARHPSAAARFTGAAPSRRTRSGSNPVEGMASHSNEAGLSQGHPHIAGYHTTTCQQLSTPQRETLPHAPFERAGFAHVRDG